MNSIPTLSVIIPAYNVKPYIHEAVESALTQSFTDLEVIVVDDGSTDGTMEALQSFNDPRLRRIEQLHAGLASTRNSGIQVARGTYLGFLDGDDLWAENKAERHLEFLRNHPEVDLTFSFARMIDESGKQLSPRSDTRGEICFQDLLIRCPHCNAVLRRETIERAGLFDPDLAGSEDLDVWLRIAMQRKGNIYCIPEFLAFYRRRAGQLTGDLKHEQEAWQQLLQKLSRLAPDEMQKSEKPANQARYRYYSFLAYEKKQYGKAFHLLVTSLRYGPWNGLLNGQTWGLIGAFLSGSILPDSFHQYLKHKASLWKCRFQ